MRLTERLSLIWHSPERLHRMEYHLMATTDEQIARLTSATDELARDLQGIRDDYAAQDAALAARLDGPISRLEAMGQDENDLAGDGAEVVADTPVADGATESA